MRFIIPLAVISTVIFILFVVFSSWYTPRDSSGELSLYVEPATQSVFLDGETVTSQGTISVSAGEHEVRVGEIWEQKIRVASGSVSSVWRVVEGDISYGYAIEHRPGTSLFGNSQKVLGVTSSPESAEVFINGTSIDKTPTILKNSSLQNTVVELRKPGYEPMQIDVLLSDSRETTLHVDLAYAPLDATPVDVTNVTWSSDTAFESFSRQKWGGGTPLLGQEPKMSRWQYIEVWAVQSEEDLDVSLPDRSLLLKEFDYISRSRHQYPAIPFAYVIDELGVIFEGLGVVDYDFSQIDPTKFRPESAPVLIVNAKSDVLNPEVIRALSALRRSLESNSSVTAIPLSTPEKQQLRFGERKELSITWKNSSAQVWNDGSSEIVAVQDPTSVSLFYDPVTWKSPTESAVSIKGPVLPGSNTTILVGVKAPYFASTERLTFKLKSTTTNEYFAHSDVVVELTSDGETDNKLRIANAPQGFVNARRDPAPQSVLLAALYNDELFGWLSHENGWYKILLRDGTQAWIPDAYTKEE